MAIDPQTTTLSNLDHYTFKRLTTALRKEEAWEKVARFIGIFDQNEISSLSLTTCPAESLLNKLATKLWTLQDLALILRECSLYDALSIISDPEPMQIIQQPTSILRGKNKLSMKIGDSLELEFGVTGIPPPKFQWFKDDEILEDQVAAVLCYDHYEPNMEGEYFCSATQEFDFGPIDQVNSEVVKIDTLPFPCTLLEAPEEFVYLCEGSPVLLKLKVAAFPKPSFQWLHKNTVLENETKEALFIKRATKCHSGEYRCFISNKANELVVKINVIIYAENTCSVYKDPVSDKVALLIANSVYEKQNNLICPPNDVCTVATILQTLGFRTICLQNLNLHELKIAIELFADCVQDKAFAFFYYAGHGFEMGDRFLLPTDCPNVDDFKKVDAVPESMILQRILDKNPALFVFLLDMCLKLPDRSENPTIYEEILDPCVYKSNRNLIRGYSTTSHLVAYERQGAPNGIYVSTLKQYLGENLPILTILGKVNTEISSKCPEQMPNISYITAQDFYLNSALRGFYQDENKIYSALNIKEEETYINGAKIRLHRYKEVFNNTLDITISGADTVDYILNSVKEVEEEEDSDKLILRVPDLQKLGQAPVSLKLRVNGADFEISKCFAIGNIFLHLKCTTKLL